MGIRACVLSHFSHILLVVTLWTVARQASLSIGFLSGEFHGQGNLVGYCPWGHKEVRHN